MNLKTASSISLSMYKLRKKSQSNAKKPDYHELSNETAYWAVATLTNETEDIT